MTAKVVILLCVGMLVIPAWAQSSPGSAESRFVGEVVGTNINVRSGPGLTAYPCVRLSSPATVTVVGKEGQWFKILPPAGCYSAIAKRYVKLDQTGKVGTITADGVVYVRAGGQLRNSRFQSIQTRLTRGQKVDIIGEVGDFYKITPPKGAYFWISEKFVKRSDKSLPAKLDKPPTTQPASPPVATKTPTTAPAVGEADAGKAPAPIDPLDAQLAAFTAAEKKLLAEFDKPHPSRDIKALLKLYRGIEIDQDSFLAPYIDARIRFLTNARQQATDIANARELIHQTDLALKEYQVKLSRLELERRTQRPIVQYAAKGILAASSLFPKNSPLGPERFVVLRPSTGKITAYIQCTTGLVDLQRYIGKFVGIMGTGQYDKRLGLMIVEATRAVVLVEPATQPTTAPAATANN